MLDATANEVSVYPTLVVGLGGTGCKIAKRLKSTLHKEGGGSLNVKFLGIDTDLSENSARTAEEMPLDQFITIGGSPVHFDPKDHTNAPVLSWLPSDEAGKLVISSSDLAAGQGAGGHRLLGRFAYNYFAPDQFVNMQHTIDQLLSLGNNPLAQHWNSVQFKYLPGLAVYVVGSLVGGTGSGCFLDALASLHRLAQITLADRSRFFSGVFLLPSVFDYRAIGSQSDDHRATAYACLKDLDLLLSTNDPALQTFSFYNVAQPFTLTQRILDTCYLVDRYSGSGALLRDEDVYDFVATHLYAAIGTPFGAAARSVDNNSHRTGIRDEAGGRCSYSAFGLVGMDYSQALLTTYCAARLCVGALDQILGNDIPQAQADEDATAFLAQTGLAGGGCRPADYIQGDVGHGFIRRPEEGEDEHTTDLCQELSQGCQEFSRALENGNLRADLQNKYRDHLSATPDTGRHGELQPGQVAPIEPQMWAYRILTHVEETVRSVGLRAGKRLADAFQTALEQAFQEYERGLADVHGNAQTAQTAFNTALEKVRAVTPTVQIFRKQYARQAKADAVRARNALVQARVREEAAALGRGVFADDTNGLLVRINRLIGQMQELQETVETVRQTLEKRFAGLELGGQEGAGALSAPDRSCLLYDVLPPQAFRKIYDSLSDRRQQLLAQMLEGGSALHLLDPLQGEDNKADALAQRLEEAAKGQFPELAKRHILEVLAEGTKDQAERIERFKKYLRDVTPRLRPHAPTQSRPGEAQTYDYCAVTYPSHPDEALNAAFTAAAEETVRDTHTAVNLVKSSGASNRIILTYMQHGIPLNEKALPALGQWLAAYEHLRPRNPYLDVDKRWMKLPGPGQRAGGGAREKLFTLGVAYGLIAQQGDFFYVNFAPGLLRRDKRASGARDQYEVDLSKVAAAITESKSPLEWFPHITQGPSAARTIPAQFGPGLGSEKSREARDRIGQGRQTALQAFVDDQGEDYQDVADAIAAVMEAYAEERGRASARDELTWYHDVLDQERKGSSSLQEHYQQEMDWLDELLETLTADGKFNLPIGKA